MTDKKDDFVKYRANFRYVGPERETVEQAMEDHDRVWQILMEQAPDLVPAHKKGKKVPFEYHKDIG